MSIAEYYKNAMKLGLLAPLVKSCCNKCAFRLRSRMVVSEDVAVFATCLVITSDVISELLKILNRLCPKTDIVRSL